MKKILVIAAHPDDEVLGCGGAIAKHSDCGDEVHIVIMAEGLTSRDVKRKVEIRLGELENLHQSSKTAAKILGASSLKIFDFPDNRMDSLDLLDVVKKIEEVIREIKPDIIYTHHIGDVNIDHQITHRAVMTACRPLPGNNVQTILFFETPSSTEWQTDESAIKFFPNWFIDINKYMNRKMQALKCYESEMRAYPHPRSYDSVILLAKYRGTTVGMNYVEAFLLGRHFVK